MSTSVTSSTLTKITVNSASLGTTTELNTCKVIKGTADAVYVWVRPFTLTITYNTGISSISVSRTSSPYKGASTGSLSNGSTIYYGDVLSCSVSAIATYYSVNSSSYSSTYTVSGNLTVSPTATHVKCQAPTFSISSFSAEGGTSSNAVLSVTNHDLTATTIHYSVTIWPLSLSSTTNYYVGSGTFTVSPGTTVSHTIYTNNTASVQRDNYVSTCDVTLYTTESGVTKSDSVTKYDSNLMSPYLTSSYVEGSTNKATLTIQNNTGVSVSYSCTSVPSRGTIRITGSGTLASGASVTLSGSYTSYYYSGTATVRFTYATHYTSVNSISYNNNYGVV